MVDHKATVAAILAGDREKFRLLADDFQRLVSHIVFRMIPDTHDREDVCQEVFVKVYQNLAGFRFGSKLSTWVAQIAYNTCLTTLGRKQASPVFAQDGNAGESKMEWAEQTLQPDAIYEAEDTSAIIRREIDNLPALPGTILVLFHLENMSLQQIAAVFGMPEGTVKSHLFRARRQLKEQLTEKYQWERP